MSKRMKTIATIVLTDEELMRQLKHYQIMEVAHHMGISIEPSPKETYELYADQIRRYFRHAIAGIERDTGIPFPVHKKQDVQNL